MTCELEDAHILVYEKKISNLQQMIKLLEEVVQSSKPLLIIAEDTDGEGIRECRQVR